MEIKSISDNPQQEINQEGAKGVRKRMLIGPNEGARVFHMRHFEVQPGGHTPHHRHDYEHEVLVLKGQATLRGETGERSAGPGAVVWIPPNELHQFINNASQPLEFICLIPAPHAGGQ